MTAHTPTPWRAIRWSSHALTTIAADTDPAEPLEHYGQKVVQYGLAEIADCRGSLRDGGNEANAARIVACVNYCDGITNDLLTEDNLAIKLEHIERLTRELRAAEEFIAGFEDDRHQGDTVTNLLRGIRDVLGEARS